MTDITFDYQGHSVTISYQPDSKGKPRYWFIIDGHPVSFVSKLDTAKRLATRFIDTITDDHYKLSKQAYFKPSHLKSQ